MLGGLKVFLYLVIFHFQITDLRLGEVRLLSPFLRKSF